MLDLIKARGYNSTVMIKGKYERTKYACYSGNASQAIVANLSPLLFITFKDLYGISYSLMGLLVFVNFITQLSIDLIFSFFSSKFNIKKTVKITPLLTLTGLIIYALSPFVFKDAVYIGLVIGTIIFAASGGLCEVLLSPVIAAIPSDKPEREMSKLHSIYAWSVVAVVVIVAVYLLIFKSENWQWLVLGLAIVPLISLILFSRAEIPEMETPEKVSGVFEILKTPTIWLCFFAIFFGGASECTMAQWSSGYLEKALNIPKAIGDVFGVAFFSVALGLGRSLYAKFGKNIEKVLFLGSIGATVCYITAAITEIAVIGIIACALTGFAVSMLWPGSLIVAEKRVKTGGVFVFAMMAAGGDLGASIGSQLLGVVTDAVIYGDAFTALATSLNVTLEQLGMKVGLLVGALFPLIGTIIFSVILKTKNKTENVEMLK